MSSLVILTLYSTSPIFASTFNELLLAVTYWTPRLNEVALCSCSSSFFVICGGSSLLYPSQTTWQYPASSKWRWKFTWAHSWWCFITLGWFSWVPRRLFIIICLGLFVWRPCSSVQLKPRFFIGELAQWRVRWNLAWRWPSWVLQDQSQYRSPISEQTQVRSSVAEWWIYEYHSFFVEESILVLHMGCYARFLSRPRKYHVLPYALGSKQD